MDQTAEAKDLLYQNRRRYLLPHAHGFASRIDQDFKSVSA
jgi:hypothetical protein